MGASSSSASSSFAPLLILLLFVLAIESRPSPQRDDTQVFQNLFGSHLSSLILGPPPSHDITEGSAYGPTASSSSSSQALVERQGAAARGLASRQEVIPRFFLDFLQRQRKFRGRSRKSMGGGRGCFGMKMDRIGTLSGLGC